MGTWGNGILSNDTSSAVYDDFMDLYDEGMDPVVISEKLIAENRETIENPDDYTNFWFPLALAQWETKSLDPAVLEKVLGIIESEADLQIWRELDASESDLKKRKAILLKFSGKLQSDRKHAKRRQKPRQVVSDPIFHKGSCLTFRLDNGNFGGAIVLEALADSVLGGNNLIASTRMNQATKPVIRDFEEAEILINNFFPSNDPKGEILWYPSDAYNEYAGLFEVIGEISITRNFSYGGVGTRSTAGWNYIKTNVDRQIAFEKTNPRPSRTIRITDYLAAKERKW